MDYNKLCKDILGLDRKVRFAGVCDETGEIRFGGQREGIKNLLTPEETKISNVQAMVDILVDGNYGILFPTR